MTRSDLIDWLARMGWSIREACRQLGISNDRWRRMMISGKVPRIVALACSALEEIDACPGAFCKSWPDNVN